MRQIVSIGGGTALAARSVHLGYTSPDALLFYNEMIVDRSTHDSFFMVCGWDTGYFGIQESLKHGKVLLFSVWDPTEGDNPHAVKGEDRVECLYHAPDVRIRRFGNEGTGGQCMGNFNWKAGETNRFVVTATVEGEKTAYSGFIHLPDKHQWKQLVTFRTRTGGRPIKRPHSFIEDFRRDRKSACEIRRARFGNAWAKAVNGEWISLNNARFTASGAEWEAKDNIDAGLDGIWFYLMTGGTTQMSTPLDSNIERDAAGQKPPELMLPHA